MLAVTLNNTPIRFASGDRQQALYNRVTEEEGRVTKLLRWLLPYTLQEEPYLYRDQLVMHNREGKPVVIYGFPFQEIPEAHYKLLLRA